MINNLIEYINNLVIEKYVHPQSDNIVIYNNFMCNDPFDIFLLQLNYYLFY